VGKVFQARIPARRPSTERQRTATSAALRFQATDGTWFLEEPALRIAQESGVELQLLREIDESELPVRFLPTGEGVVFEPAPEDARLAVLARLLAEDRARGEEHVRFLGRHRPVPPDGFELDRAGGARRYIWQIIPAELAEPTLQLRERFPHLRALLHDHGTRFALSLGSGGLKLFSHATALRLLEAMGVHDSIDELWGTSGGALATVLYSHGLSPEAIEQTGYDLYAGRYDLSIHPSKIQVLRHLIREALAPSEHDSHAGFVDCTESLARMIDRYCSTLRPQRPLYAIAYNLAECRAEVLTPQPVPRHLEGLHVQTGAREAALASAAVPLLFVPRRIRVEDREIPYIDGSTTEEVPIYSIVQKWDMDRAAGFERRERLVILYVKLTGQPSMYRTPHGRMGKLRLLQTVASAGMETMHQRDVALISMRSDVHLLPLELPGSNPDFFEIRRIPDFVRRAKDAFPERLQRIEKFLADG
jgi:hypothetical protein